MTHCLLSRYLQCVYECMVIFNKMKQVARFHFLASCDCSNRTNLDNSNICHIKNITETVPKLNIDTKISLECNDYTSTTTPEKLLSTNTNAPECTIS